MAKKKYRILDADVFTDKASAQFRASQERKLHKALGAEVRTFPRNVRAGGATVALFVVVVRVPLHPTPAAVVAGETAPLADDSPSLEGAQ